MAMVKLVFDQWFADAWPAHQRRLAEWQVGRVRTASRLLGVAESEVGWAEIVWCHHKHGVPPLEHEAPKFADQPMDGRVRKAVAG
jgi:hypothetical protein